jgi:hypothetical protein
MQVALLAPPDSVNQNFSLLLVPLTEPQHQLGDDQFRVHTFYEPLSPGERRLSDGENSV